MSKVTSPILLDSTGRDINDTLTGIHNVLKAANTIIDDSAMADDRVWSSKKIIEALATEAIVEGTSVVTFDAIAATPLTMEAVISNAPTTIAVTLEDSRGNTDGFEYLVPANGTYYLDTGLIILENGQTTKIEPHYLPAYQGHNTFTITNVDSIKVTYKTIKTGGGGTADFDLIHGGSAREEA